MGDELLGLGHQPAFVDQPRPDALLYALHEHAVLGADLGVEGERLLYPGLVGVRVDEVVQEAVPALGRERDDRPTERFGRPGIALMTVPGKRTWN